MESVRSASETTSPSRPGLELVRANAEAFNTDSSIIIPEHEECKEDVDTLTVLCIELTRFLHVHIGAGETQKLVSGGRGQQ